KPEPHHEDWLNVTRPDRKSEVDEETLRTGRPISQADRMLHRQRSAVVTNETRIVEDVKLADVVELPRDIFPFVRSPLPRPANSVLEAAEQHAISTRWRDVEFVPSAQRFGVAQ